MLQMARRFTRIAGEIVGALVVAMGLSSMAGAQQPVVEELVLNDTVQPVSAGQLDRAIALANSEGAAALLIELNTPGGLVDSMRQMAGAILASRVPVIAYVTPSGGRAAKSRPRDLC